MDNDLEHFGDEIQKELDEDARAVYSEKVIRYANNPENLGRLDVPDAAAEVKGLCGDTMEIYVTITSGTITDASFMTDGCGPTIACGVALTKMLKGKSLMDALHVSPGDILRELDGLPYENVHCAILATTTFYKAVSEYLINT